MDEIDTLLERSRRLEGRYRALEAALHNVRFGRRRRWRRKGRRAYA